MTGRKGTVRSACQRERAERAYLTVKRRRRKEREVNEEDGGERLRRGTHLRGRHECAGQVNQWEEEKRRSRAESPEGRGRRVGGLDQLEPIKAKEVFEPPNRAESKV